MKNVIGLALGIISLIPYSVNAQDNKKKYEEAELRMNNNRYDQALPIFLSIDSSAKGNNNNINFQIGECYLNAPIHQEKAIPYLIKATGDISDKYDPMNFKERHAPADAFLYLGKAYHVSYQFDSAIKYYVKFASGVLLWGSGAR